MNLRELLPDFPVRKHTHTSDQPRGTRRSGRPKKPPLRFDEEADPPKSAKKKVSSGVTLEGTSHKPLHISDWSNEQLANYCGACGVEFSDPVNVCFDHIRLLERSRAVRDVAESSEEVRGN